MSSLRIEKDQGWNLLKNDFGFIINIKEITDILLNEIGCEIQSGRTLFTISSNVNFDLYDPKPECKFFKCITFVF